MFQQLSNSAIHQLSSPIFQSPHIAGGQQLSSLLAEQLSSSKTQHLNRVAIQQLNISIDQQIDNSIAD